MKLNKILLLVNVFLLQIYLIRFSIGSYPTNVQEILIGAQVIVFLIAMWRERRLVQTIKNIPHHFVLLSLVVLAILATILNPIFDLLTLIRHAKFLFFAVLLVFMLLETFQTSEERRAMMRIMGLGALLFGVFSFVYNVLGYNVAQDDRILGPLDSAVYLGYYLTPFFLFFTFEAIERRKYSALIPAVILAILILATRSMGSIAGSFIVILLYLLKRSDLEILKKRGVKMMLGFIFLAVFAAVFYTKILPTIQTRWSSLDERFEIWSTSVELLKNPRNDLLGLGFGQFQYHFIQTVDQVLGRKPLHYIILQPHNFLLLFLFQFGLLGLIFILYCLYRTIKGIVKLKPRDQTELTWHLLLLYFFLHGFIDTPWFKNDLLFLFVLLLGLTVIEKAVHKDELPHF